MRRIAVDTSLTNQNISSALLTYTYTADDNRLLFIRLFADQVAGNGIYVAYVTIQRGGAGSAYRVVPRTDAAVASGVTSICMTTIAFPVSNTDVVKVYITGLAGDTVTPDIITEIWEDDALRPTTEGQHDVDTTSGGAVGVDWGNIENKTTTNALTNTSIASVDAITNTYQAKVEFVDDDTGTTDRYVVSWFKNGEPVTAGVTVATLQVIKTDGSDLIASSAMTLVAGTSNYYYSATGAERMVSGSSYIAVASATIDSAVRTWRQPVGVDS